MCACLCVCSPPRLLVTSGVMWAPYDWLNKFCGFKRQLYSVLLVGVA